MLSAEEIRPSSTTRPAPSRSAERAGHPRTRCRPRPVSRLRSSSRAQHAAAAGVERRQLVEAVRGDVGVAARRRAPPLGPGAADPCASTAAVDSPRLAAEQLVDRRPVDLDAQVEAVEQRAGQAAQVPGPRRSAHRHAPGAPARRTGTGSWRRRAGTGPGTRPWPRPGRRAPRPPRAAGAGRRARAAANSASSSRNSTPPLRAADLARAASRRCRRRPSPPSTRCGGARAAPARHRAGEGASDPWRKRRHLAG